MPGNRHAPFGGGRFEKDAQRTSPAAYPTRSLSTQVPPKTTYMAVRSPTCFVCGCSIAPGCITAKAGETTFLIPNTRLSEGRHRVCIRRSNQCIRRESRQ